MKTTRAILRELARLEADRLGHQDDLKSNINPDFRELYERMIESCSIRIAQLRWVLGEPKEEE